MSGARRTAVTQQAAREHIPLEVSIEITHHCNFRCEHCYIPDFTAPDLLSTERILSLLEELAAAGTLHLTLTGGEMFLRRDWHEIASRARALGFSLRLFSNGALVDEAVADLVASLWCPVEISYYSTDPAVFERITQRPGSFERTRRGVLLLRQRSIDVLLKVPIMKWNVDGVPAVFGWAAEIGADCKADPKIVPKKDGDLVPLGTRAPEHELLPYYRGPHSGCSLPTNGEWGDQPLCAAGNRYASIDAAGNVQACNILPGVAGNVRERPFGEIWTGSPWLGYLRGLRRSDLPVCGTCDKMTYCGRCYAQALMEDGDLLGPSSWACAHAAALEEALESG